MRKKAYQIGYFAQLLLVVSLLCVAQLAHAQKTTVTGVVVDNTNFPLPGVNITVKGTNIGTISDLDGAYSIEAPNKDAVLNFTYVGFRTKEVEIKGQTKLVTIMEESTLDLDEVVVVGYGVQKKSHLTGSITKYKDENLGDMAVSRLDQALQGKIAGVTIQNTTTEAGAAPQIRVRGMGSISASNEPLVVVDGHPIADGMSFVDMNDVESVEVLKDAASAAIYGSRGANGVILITTKTGSISKAKYSVKAYTGFKTVYKFHDMLSAGEYVDMLTSDLANGGKGPTKNELAWKSIDNYTDWQKEGTRDVAQINNVQFSLSGGKKEAQYYISASYTGDEGIMINSKYDKFNMRAKLDAALTDRVSVGVNIAPTYSRRETPASNFIDFYRTYSWLPVKHTAATSLITGQPIGSYAHGRHFNNKDYQFIDEDGNPYVDTASPWGTNNNNPRCIMDNESRFTDDYRLNTSAYIDINFGKGFTFRSSNGFFVRYQRQDIYHNTDARSDGDANYSRYTNLLLIDLLSENTFNYTKSINRHDFSVMLGFTANKTTAERAGIQGSGFPNDYIHTINAAPNIVIADADGTRRTYTTKEEEILTSMLGRITYSYADKYLFSASFRTDGSSKFGPDNRWAYFPSVSVGWRASEEEFIRNIVEMDQLKFRASWGVTGNNDIPNYAAYNKLGSANYTFGTDGTITPGLANTSNVLGNSAITWEQTNEFNIGFDLSILKSRVNLSMDYYYAITKSLLFKQPAMAITGHNEYWNNIGKVRNRGLEIELNTFNVKSKNFDWQTSLNFSTNSNVLLQLGGEEQMLNFGERSEVYIAKVGSPSIQYYGYKTNGIWLSQEEINNSGLSFVTGKNVVPGTLKIVNQNTDNVIDAYDRVPLGDPFPDFTWGMTNTFRFKNFDFSFFIQGVQGITVLNGDGYYQETKKINRAYVENRFISPEHIGDGKTPHFSNGDGMPWELTDYLLQDGSYAALRDLTIGYKFPKKVLQKLGLSSLRLYASGQNLFYLWSDDYKGINPEARYTSGQYSSSLIEGYQRGAFPLQRTFSAGFNLGF